MPYGFDDMMGGAVAGDPYDQMDRIRRMKMGQTGVRSPLSDMIQQQPAGPLPQGFAQLPPGEAFMRSPLSQAATKPDFGLYGPQTYASGQYASPGQNMPQSALSQAAMGDTGVVPSTPEHPFMQSPITAAAGADAPRRQAGRQPDGSWVMEISGNVPTGSSGMTRMAQPFTDQELMSKLPFRPEQYQFSKESADRAPVPEIPANPKTAAEWYAFHTRGGPVDSRDVRGYLAQAAADAQRSAAVEAEMARYSPDARSAEADQTMAGIAYQQALTAPGGDVKRAEIAYNAAMERAKRSRSAPPVGSPDSNIVSVYGKDGGAGSETPVSYEALDAQNRLVDAILGPKGAAVDIPAFIGKLPQYKDDLQKPGSGSALTREMEKRLPGARKSIEEEARKRAMAHSYGIQKWYTPEQWSVLGDAILREKKQMDPLRWETGRIGVGGKPSFFTSQDAIDQQMREMEMLNKLLAEYGK